VTRPSKGSRLRLVLPRLLVMLLVLRLAVLATVGVWCVRRMPLLVDRRARQLPLCATGAAAGAGGAMLLVLLVLLVLMGAAATVDSSPCPRHAVRCRASRAHVWRVAACAWREQQTPFKGGSRVDAGQWSRGHHRQAPNARLTSLKRRGPSWSEAGASHLAAAAAAAVTQHAQARQASAMPPDHHWAGLTALITRGHYTCAAQQHS
jgi:hypothetical protein